MLKQWLFIVAISCGSTNAFAQPVPCVGNDLTEAKSARNEAKESLDAAVNFLRGNDTNTKKLMLRWFGRNDKATSDRVSGILGRTANWAAKVSSFYCLYSNDGSMTELKKAPDGTLVVHDISSNLYAYVYPADLGRIYIGLQFFKAPATGPNSKLGTIIHEVTHYFLTGNTDDKDYGKADCLALALKNPDDALKNADNYQYFVEEWLDS